MIKKIDHMVITTSNIDECIAFYKKLGFTVKIDNERYEIFNGDFKINVHIKGNELFPHAKNVEVGSLDFCLEITDSIDVFKKQLEDMNIEIELGIVERDGVKGRMKSIYIRDFDGNLIEFCSYQ